MSVSKSIEYVLLGLGYLIGIFFILFWIGIFLSPLAFITYFVKIYILPWDAMDTFGAVIIGGVFGFIFIVATWGK